MSSPADGGRIALARARMRAIVQAMGWLPTSDWSGRLMTVGAVLVAVAVVVALASEVARPNAPYRTIALALVILGVMSGVVGIGISGLGQETVRRGRAARLGPFYGARAAYLWQSLPPIGKIAFGVVVPVAAISIVVLVLAGAPRQVVIVTWVLSLILFGALLTLASRTTVR